MHNFIYYTNINYRYHLSSYYILDKNIKGAEVYMYIISSNFGYTTDVKHVFQTYIIVEQVYITIMIVSVVLATINAIFSR